MSKKCRDCCKAELDPENDCLRCHAEPPKIKFPYTEMRVWPMVMAEDWCWQFEPTKRKET